MGSAKGTTGRAEDERRRRLKVQRPCTERVQQRLIIENPVSRMSAMAPSHAAPKVSLPTRNTVFLACRDPAWPRGACRRAALWACATMGVLALQFSCIAVLVAVLVGARVRASLWSFHGSHKLNGRCSHRIRLLTSWCLAMTCCSWPGALRVSAPGLFAPFGLPFLSFFPLPHSFSLGLVQLRSCALPSPIACPFFPGVSISTGM